jgi:5-deoxy-glucuronate isomerase
MTEPAVHPTALPDDRPAERLMVRADEQGLVAIDPDSAGWRYLSFRTARLGVGESLEIGSPDSETAVVNLFGGDLVVDLGAGSPNLLEGRASVFADMPSAFYLPAGRTASVAGAAGRGATSTTLAIATAPTRPDVSAALGPVLIRPEDIVVERRGAGRSTRQINHIITPAFRADRLLLVEVLTPAGNWSSWPPHKHDIDDMPAEAVLEEIYQYRFRRPEAWAFQRVYRPAGSPLGRARDGAWAVRDGDTVIVPDGYHPFSATDADDAWYLNALAGDRRTMACSFDPTLDHVRQRWSDEAPDPRVPLVPARHAT